MIVLDELLKDKEPSIRRLVDIGEVLYDRKWYLNADKTMELYYMYRDIHLEERDRKIMEEYSLRYDVTVIPPKKLGPEFVKTLGHYHPDCSNGVSFPEIYEVIEGVGHFLMQKKEGEKITDVVVVEAKKGDKVIAPPNYGHITINPSDKPLKMANFVEREFCSAYSDIKEKGGGAYFEIEGNSFVKNTSYGKLPRLRIIKPRYNSFGFNKNKDMYRLFMEDPSLFDFLITPDRYVKKFEDIIKG